MSGSSGGGGGGWEGMVSHMQSNPAHVEMLCGLAHHLCDLVPNRP